MKRCAIFDLDGTLVDSLADIALHTSDAMAAHGFVRPSLEQVKSWIGGGARDLVAQALASVGSFDAAVEDSVLAKLLDLYHERPIVHTAAYDGVHELLAQCQRNGIVLAVLSNKPHALTVAITAKLCGHVDWHAVYGQRDGIAKKPDPTVALQIAHDAGVVASNCWFIGDSVVDVATGRNADMSSCAVEWGFSGATELAAAGPHHQCKTIAELAAVLQR